MTGLSKHGVLSLVAAFRDRLERDKARAPAAIAEEIDRILDRLRRVDRTYTPTPIPPHPLRKHLPQTLAILTETSPRIAGILAPLAGLLPWRYGYQPRADYPGLDQAMGWAELVGPKAPFRSDEVCLGLTLIGPDTYYRPHHHPAIELYHVLAGHAEWTADTQSSHPSPGTYILHHSGQVHAMRTNTEPLLALYAWTGDVHAPSEWTAPHAIQHEVAHAV